MKKAIIFGSTGLTGSALLDLALPDADYSTVICFTRKPLPVIHEKLQNIVTDFTNLDAYGNLFQNAVVFCCLGTTIKAAGYDKEKFKEADLYRPLLIAETAVKCNSDQVLVVSALGADKNSRLFYNQVKGELDERLQELPLLSLHIMHPSMLMGRKKNIRFGERAGEILSAVLSPLMMGGAKKYRPISATTVARAMLRIAGLHKKGKYIYPSDQLQELGHV